MEVVMDVHFHSVCSCDKRFDDVSRDFGTHFQSQDFFIFRQNLVSVAQNILFVKKRFPYGIVRGFSRERDQQAVGIQDNLSHRLCSM